jgi:hypothetical protein
MLRSFNDFTSYNNKSSYFFYSPSWRQKIISKFDDNLDNTNMKNLILKEGGIIKDIDIHEIEKGNRTINSVKELDVNN